MWASKRSSGPWAATSASHHGTGERVDRIGDRRAHRPDAAAIRSTLGSSRAGEVAVVEPGEALAAGTELRARAERDAAALEEGRRRVVAEAERAAVEPGQVAGGWLSVADLGQVLGEQLAEQAAVRVEDAR